MGIIIRAVFVVVGLIAGVVGCIYLFDALFPDSGTLVITQQANAMIAAALFLLAIASGVIAALSLLDDIRQALKE